MGLDHNWAVQNRKETGTGERNTTARFPNDLKKTSAVLSEHIHIWAFSRTIDEPYMCDVRMEFH